MVGHDGEDHLLASLEAMMIEHVEVTGERVHVAMRLPDSARQVHVFAIVAVESWSERLGVTPEEAIDELVKEVPDGGPMSEQQRARVMEAYNAFRKVQQIRGRSDRGAGGGSPSSASSPARRGFLAGVADDRGTVPASARRRVGARKRFADKGTGRPGPEGSLDRLEDRGTPDWVV